MAGTTLSSNFPVTTVSATYRGAGDAFVLKIAENSAASLFVPIIISSAGINNSFYTSELTLTNRGTKTATVEFTYTKLSVEVEVLLRRHCQLDGKRLFRTLSLISSD